MFKIIRALGRSFAYQPVSLLSQSGHVKIQRVHIVRPFFRQKRLRSLAVAVIVPTFLLYSALDSYGAYLEEEEISEIEDDEEDEEDEEGIPEIMPEDALFIPFGSVHKLPRTYYKGSDPEWQSFIELANDKVRSDNLRYELSHLVGNELVKFPSFPRVMGVPLIIRTAWLDIDFPNGPPPEYERSGIEITKNYIAWTYRPISANDYYRLRNVLRPLPALSAFWASYRVMWSLQLARIREMLTVQSKQENIDGPSPTAFISLPRVAPAGQNEETRPNAGTEKPSLPEPQDESFEDGGARDHSEITPNPGKSGFSRDFPSLDQDLRTALNTFAKTLSKNWTEQRPVQRGACVISGLLEIEGSKAVCIIDVRASYHVRESRWIELSLGIRRLQPRELSPKGGG